MTHKKSVAYLVRADVKKIFFLSILNFLSFLIFKKKIIFINERL